MKECALKGNLIAVNIRLYAMKVKNRVNIQDCENRIENSAVHWRSSGCLSSQAYCAL